MHDFLTAAGFDAYDDALTWSVEDPAAFWSTIADYFGVRWSHPPRQPLEWSSVERATWFEGATLSYAEHALCGPGKDDDAPALHYASELGSLRAWTWGELRRETARIRGGLEALGVTAGDRVCAYLPNLPQTAAAMLATSSLGAIWSSAAPEFGAGGVIDRFAQLQPKVLLAVDGYRYAGRDFDRAEHVAAIHEAVGGQLVRFGHLDGGGWQPGFLTDRPLTFTPVPFEHPLWVLYSSGTTGLPKAIVHSHGGIVLEHLKQLGLHADAGPDTRLMWFTTTGWMMWNWLVGGLLVGAQLVLYDGSPAGDALWDLAEQAQVTTFGTSPAWLEAQRKAGSGRRRRPPHLTAIGCTGAPLSPETARWISGVLGPEVWLFSISGGTDVCTAFAGGVPTLAVYADEMQRPCLGCRLEARSGELVVAAPLPSMPVAFWGDDDSTRLHDAYFAAHPGVWTHGDFVQFSDRGGVTITGRSDATINRGGVRIGTAEIYRAVLALDDVDDAVVVETDDRIVMFAALRTDRVNEEIRAALTDRIRRYCSPRHVPDDIVVVPAIPRTLSGKAVEVPIKRILLGDPPTAAISLDSLANPQALQPVIDYEAGDRSRCL